MSQKKLRVGLLFGGKSAEHEVSLQSAKHVFEAIDKKRFEPILIGIDKEGIWHLNDAEHILLHENNPKFIALNKSVINLSLIPGVYKNQIQRTDLNTTIGNIDVVFPILHGSFGEDGSIQGLFRVLNIPFVGSSVCGSACAMDKDVSKRLFRDANLTIANFITLTRHHKNSISFQSIKEKLGLPLFVKPANLGSSVGISKINTESDFVQALDEAFLYDRKIIIEENIIGREIECSVLGNENPIASTPGEIISNQANHQFYSYSAKYIDEHGAILQIPAKLTHEKAEEIKALAIKAFTTLCCEGMARVDFFMNNNGNIIINEINTIPGFTAISMYPKLWEESGISYTELVSELIDLAMERFKDEKDLKTTIH